MGELHALIYEQDSGHMGISNAEIGELDSRVVYESIEEVGALDEDRSDVMVGVLGGKVCFVGEVPVEETFCAAAGVACFEDNVMEDVGERERLVGAGNPCFQTCAQFEERGVISYVHGVPNCTRELPEVRVEVPIGGLDIHSVQLHISGGGVRCAADHGQFKEKWEERAGQWGNANTVQNFGGVGVNMRDTEDIGCEISNLSFDCLVDEVRDWGCGAGWQGGTDQRDGEAIDQDVADGGASLVGQRLVR